MELGNLSKRSLQNFVFSRKDAPLKKSIHFEDDGILFLGVIVFQRYNSKLTVDQKIRILQRNAQRV